MTYQKKIKAHLKGYKNDNFKEIEDGKWKRNKKTYCHIFPEDKWKLNLLTPYEYELEKYIEEKKIKKHTDFHHLNSSQAMCLNFFYPLIKEKELDIILKIIGFDKDEKVNYNSVCFEKKSKVEKKNKTCFDFYLETESEKKLFFEIKYSEQDFGKGNENEERKKKFENDYKNNLNSIKDKFHNSKDFLENYQILRNLVCINDDSYVCFLYPSENKAIKNKSKDVPSNFLKAEFHKNFKNITWEELVSFTDKESENQNIKKQLKKFKEKYKV